MKPSSRRKGRFASVLCPVDFSKHSRLALRYAAAIAEEPGGRLTVLFVNDPLLAAAATAAYDEKTMARKTLAALRRFVAASVSADAAAAIEYLIEVGSPAQTIAAHARGLRSDLIVLGTHGLTGAKKLFFGSTTRDVLRHAPVPVLAVPLSGPGKPAAKMPAARLMNGRFITPIDLTSGCEKDARAAADVARAFDAELVLVHVVPELGVPGWLEIDLADQNRNRLERARGRLDRVIRGLGPGLKASARVVTGRPADGISAVAREERAALIVMTLQQRGWLGPAPGTITYQILCGGIAPVLALPGRIGRARTRSKGRQR